jgi:hypothetical protein
MRPHAATRQLKNYTQRRSIAAARHERTRIAMRKNARTDRQVVQQIRAEIRHRPAGFAILRVDCPRLCEQYYTSLGARLRLDPSHPAHPLQRPKQIHRRGPTRRQIVANFTNRAPFLHSNAHAIRRRHTNRRRSSHAQALDRVPHFLNRAAIQINHFYWQSGLIQQHKMSVNVAFPTDSRKRVQLMPPYTAANK